MNPADETREHCGFSAPSSMPSHRLLLCRLNRAQRTALHLFPQNVGTPPAGVCMCASLMLRASALGACRKFVRLRRPCSLARPASTKLHCWRRELRLSEPSLREEVELPRRRLQRTARRSKSFIANLLLTSKNKHIMTNLQRHSPQRPTPTRRRPSPLRGWQRHQNAGTPKVPVGASAASRAHSVGA